MTLSNANYVILLSVRNPGQCSEFRDTVERTCNQVWNDLQDSVTLLNVRSEDSH